MKKLVTILTLAIAMLSILCFCASCQLFIKCDINFIVDGKNYETVQLKQTDKVTMPKDPKKKGFEFDGWYLDENVWQEPFTANSLLDMPLTDKMEIYVYAKWKNATTADYKVEYYLQNIEDDNYPSIPFSTVEKTGNVGEKVSAEIRSIEHFTATAQNVEGQISADGALVLKVFYTRNKYNVTFNPNGGTLESGFLTQQVKYGGDAIEPVFTRTGYTPSYDKSFENIQGDTIINVGWQINQYTLTIDFGNGAENKVITQNYGTTIEKIEKPEKEGYAFICYSTDIPETMPAQNLTIKAVWQSLFLHRDGVIVGLTQYGGDVMDLVIPDNIDGTPITAINDAAFLQNQSLFSVTIAEGISYIGTWAFGGCFSLESVVIGSVTSDIENANTVIAEQAFTECMNLKDVVIGNNVTTISEEAFELCKITNLTIGKNVVSIGSYAFENSSLTSVYYGGTQEDWENIDIDTGNTNLTSATRYYYVEYESDSSADNGNYWHYVDGVPTVWTKTEE